MSPPPRWHYGRLADGVALGNVSDVVGRDAAGRTVIQLAADDWLLDQLLSFDSHSEDLEHGGDAEPDDDTEPDGPRMLRFDRL